MKSLINNLRRSATSATSTTSPASPASSTTGDIVSRLPVELQLTILEEFSPDDFIAALNACASWRYVWLSESIWPSLADRWFPGLSEHIRTSGARGSSHGEVFRRTLYKSLRRSSGRFSSALHHGMWLEDDRFFKLSRNVPVAQGGVHSYRSVRDSEPGQERFARFLMYNNGRIAWWPEGFGLPFFAIVDDLRTRKRRAYLFPDHKGERQGYKTAMSNQLLLMGNDKILHAWHLELDCIRSVGIPEPLVRCVAEGASVLIVSRYAAVYFWEFGRPLQHIDMSAVPGYDLGPITTAGLDDSIPYPRRNITSLKRNDMLVDFIIHPTTNNVFFVITLLDGKLVVHEFNNTTLTNSHCMGHHVFSREAMRIPGHLRWEKIDSRGSYGLFSKLYRHDPSDNNQDLKDFYACCGVRDVFVTVCFNIYTKSFAVLRHHSPMDFPSTFHVWNRRLASLGQFRGSGGWYISLLDPCEDKLSHSANLIPRDMSMVPFYTTSPSRRQDPSILTRRRRHPLMSRMLSQDTHYLWCVLDATQTYAKHKVLRHGPTETRTSYNNPTVVGDDDFLVFLNHHIYTVWGFGDETKT